MTAGAVLSALSRVAATQKTDNESRQEMTVPNAAAAASEQTAALCLRSADSREAEIMIVLIDQERRTFDTR